MQSASERPQLLALPDGAKPQIGDDVFVAPGATLVGAVELLHQASVWYGARLRADCGGQRIVIGEGSNLQDNVSVHVDVEHGVRLGSGVSVGHNAVLHGCEIGDDVLVGMGAVVLNGAHIGAGSLIAAGAVVLPETQIPPRSLVTGVPAKVRREIDEEGLAAIRQNAVIYLDLAGEHVMARPV